MLPSDARAAKESGSKTRNKFTAEEASEGLEQRERFTEKLTDLQKRLSNFIIDTPFNAKRKGKIILLKKTAKCLSIEKLINKL